MKIQKRIIAIILCFSLMFTFCVPKRAEAVTLESALLFALIAGAMGYTVVSNDVIDGDALLSFGSHIVDYVKHSSTAIYDALVSAVDSAVSTGSRVVDFVFNYETYEAIFDAIHSYVGPTDSVYGNVYTFITTTPHKAIFDVAFEDLLRENYIFDHFNEVDFDYLVVPLNSIYFEDSGLYTVYFGVYEYIPTILNTSNYMKTGSSFDTALTFGGLPQSDISLYKLGVNYSLSTGEFISVDTLGGLGSPIAPAFDTLTNKSYVTFSNGEASLLSTVDYGDIYRYNSKGVFSLGNHSSDGLARFKLFMEIFTPQIFYLDGIIKNHSNNPYNVNDLKPIYDVSAPVVSVAVNDDLLTPVIPPPPPMGVDVPVSIGIPTGVEGLKDIINGAIDKGSISDGIAEDGSVLINTQETAIGSPISVESKIKNQSQSLIGALSSLIIPKVFPKTFDTLLAMDTSSVDPPVITINLHKILDAGLSEINSDAANQNPFPDKESTFIDFGMLNNFSEKGVPLIDYFRSLIGFGVILLTIRVIWKKLTPEHVL